MDPLSAALFLAFGLAAGAYGTVVGLGGGFLIVPAMLLVYQATPQAAVGTSLTVVFLNALSGSISYARQRRIDVKTGLKFGLATIPGAVLGAYLSSYIASRLFSFAFGLLLLLLAGFLLWKPDTEQESGSAAAPAGRGQVLRRLVDARGNTFVYSFNERNGIILSFFVGLLYTMLGVGGGIIHVPALIHLFSFPAQVATATSYFILVFTTGVGAASHLALRHVLAGPAISMGVGVVIGAQLGAALSLRLRGAWIVRLLSGALALVGVRLIMGALIV